MIFNSTPVSAALGVEITLNLIGVYQPGMRAPARRGEPPTEPDDDPFVEDIAIDALLIESLESFASMALAGRTKRAFLTYDLLQGVDTSNPHIHRFLSNLLACVEEDAARELLEAL